MHTTTVAHKDVIAGLVGKYITTDGKVNPWFKRKLDEQPLEVRDEVLRLQIAHPVKSVEGYFIGKKI